jgi:hypothetical protein
MKRFLKFVGVLAMIGGWPLAMSALHAVHVPGQRTVLGMTLPQWASWHLLTKEKITFRETFVDTRTWQLNDIADHTAVANRLERAGLGSAFAHAGTPEEVAAALKGEKKPEPVPAAEPAKEVVPAAPAEAAPKSTAKKVEHQTPAKPAAAKPAADAKPATDAKDNVFAF